MLVFSIIRPISNDILLFSFFWDIFNFSDIIVVGNCKNDYYSLLVINATTTGIMYLSGIGTFDEQPRIQKREEEYNMKTSTTTRINEFYEAAETVTMIASSEMVIIHQKLFVCI